MQICPGAVFPRPLSCFSNELHSFANAYFTNHYLTQIYFYFWKRVWTCSILIFFVQIVLNMKADTIVGLFLIKWTFWRQPTLMNYDTSAWWVKILLVSQNIVGESKYCWWIKRNFLITLLGHTSYNKLLESLGLLYSTHYLV